MNNQRELEKLLIAELRQQEALSDIITEYEIENVRVCDHCHRLMNQGWLYMGGETYCSDRCMMAEHPEEDLTEIKLHAEDDVSETYWTEWEG